MSENYSEFKIPSFAKRETYNFAESTNEDLLIYEELNAIAQEIEKCRLRNC
ncbi:hypothetical protein IKF32_02720 [Candidatus Saccharibacteria bacterium]|nr:hypothetical protein [Candidatus Saccharibacteria bacterium]